MDIPPPYSPPVPAIQQRSQDFDTVSIRSAAPSYVSRAPSYVSTSPSPFQRAGATSGLQARANSQPILNDFRIRTWSATSYNPTARQYHSVAHRRATREQQQLLAATGTPNGLQSLQERLGEEERERIRPLEDPELVGEEAAKEARLARLAREGTEALIQEDKRWDWMLSQMKDWEEREKSWKYFRKEVEKGNTNKLARRLGLRK